MKKSGLKILVVFVFLASVLLSACGEKNQVEKVSGQFVGIVDNSNAFVGLVAYTDGQLGAYICDGEKILEWFRGPVDGITADIINKAGAHLVVVLSTASASGSITLTDGTVLKFSASPVAKPTTAEPLGFYRAEETIDGIAYVGGWIVLPTGEQRGAISGGSKLISAPAIPASSKTVNVSGVGTFTPGWKDPEPQP